MKNNNISEQQMEELKDAVKQALANYDSEAVIQMLIQQGYDPFYAQSIVEEAEQEEGSVIPSSEQTEDTSSEDAMLEQQAQAQQEEDALEAARQQMLAEQQQMADEDVAADDYQDYEEDQYFNFAAGGTQMGQYGIDIEPMPNAQYSQGEEQPYVTWPTMEGDLMRDGGIPNKRSFLRKMTKHLMKANEGMEQSSKIPSPYGDVDNPTGNDLSGKNNFISALNKQTQMFQAKQQAEQMYNNMYSKNVGGDVTQYGPPADLHDPLEHLHQYGEALNHELPLDTSMETMQFGGFKNRRIKRANRALFGVPFIPPGAEVDYQFGPLGGLRRASANIDTAALAELFKMLPGSPNANPLITFNDALKEITYQYEGELVDDPATVINKQTIKEVADKTDNEVAKKISSETPIVKSSVIPKSPPVKSTKVSPSKKDAWGRPEGDPWYNFDPAAKKFKNSTTTNQSGLPTVGKDDKPYEQPKLRSNKSLGIWDMIKLVGKVTNPSLYNMFEEGGFVDAQNPNLYKFNYGGDDISIPYINDTDMYRKGGRILPQAQPGLSTFDQFRLQKLNPDGSQKNPYSLPGGAELMGNPYRQPQRSAVAPSPSPAPNQQQGQQMSPQQMQQMQQYMQMMQQMPFAYGPARGLGRAALKGLTGLSRDFNYFTGDNPGNWNIPEGYTNLRKESFKDRGKWYNPFDTKRVTTYEYTKPGEAGAPGAPGSNTNPPGSNADDSYGFKSNTEGLSGKSKRAIRRGERQTARQTARGMEEFPEAFEEGTVNPFAKESAADVPASNAPAATTDNNAPGYNPNASAPGYSGAYSDANGDGIPDYLAVPGSPQGSAPASNFGSNPARAYSGSGLGAMERADAFDISQTQPQPTEQQNVNASSAAPQAPAYNTLYPAGMSSSTGIDSIYEPDMYDMGTSDATPENVYFNTQLSNPGMSNPYGRQNPLAMPTPNLDRRAQAPGRPGPQLSNPGMSNPYSRPNPLSLGFAEGGFIPDYYTFDGYLPMASPGIISDTEDFQNIQDPNAIKYRIEEQSGWSWNPAQLGNTSSLLKNATSNQFENMASLQAQRAGSNKINYASDINRQPVYRGLTDQEGVEKKVGFESGRTYMGKYGGQYKHGGTYSLTREQIDQIRKMGGDVEFI